MSWLGPVGIGVSFVLLLLPIPGIAPVARGLMIAGVLPAGVRGMRRLQRPHRRWMALLAATLFAMALSWVLASALGIAGPDTLTSFATDLFRQSYLAVVVVLLAAGLRTPEARLWLDRALAAVSLVVAVRILTLYVAHAGFALVSAEELKVFKATASFDQGVDINPLTYAMALAAIASWSVWTRTRRTTLLFAGVVGLATLVSGARTTQLGLILGFLATSAVRLFRGLPPRGRAAALSATGLSALAGVVVLAGSELAVDPLVLSAVTTGRYDLWVAAVTKFNEHPWTGWGVGTWKDDLHQFLPYYYEYLESLIDLKSGGFHNAYLTVLAERGLVAFLPALATLVFTGVTAFRLYRHRALLTASDLRFSRGALFAFAFIVFCGLAEYCGLLGPANSLGDFVAYCLAARIIATAGELDALRGARALAADAGPPVAAAPLTLVTATTPRAD